MKLYINDKYIYIHFVIEFNLKNKLIYYYFIKSFCELYDLTLFLFCDDDIFLYKYFYFFIFILLQCNTRV